MPIARKQGFPYSPGSLFLFAVFAGGDHMTKPCQDGYRCPYGRKESDTTIVCSMPRCVITERDEDKGFRFFERLMQGHGTYERRAGKVKQRRFSGGG